ncbi:S49 family peptidase [Rhodobacter lacus]|uniref:S49 family peptidase n=1 Tax=Rhodobacter lacus TaxID=1641972 RepID=A0ABW5AEF6_9RHOB
MRSEIGAMLAGAPVAIAAEFAREMLAREVPEAAARGAEAAAGAERFTVQRGLAVVPVRGILTPNSAVLEAWFGWSTYFGLAETMAELAERADVAAIVLDLDSPGGLVLGCEDAAQAVAVAGARKPVHAIAAPMAASAAYWLASQASSIALTPGAVVGSIGVALEATSVVGPDARGVQAYRLTSRHARAKRPDPGTEAGMAELVRALDEIEAAFHAAVARGRNIAPGDLATRLSVSGDPCNGGACFRGAEAVARGLADTVETRAAFYARMISAHGAAARPAPSARFGALAAAAKARAAL